ncbi:UNVERIFIED_CONTAM: hypothetical protein K2H54_058841 [Gekko kuhli]
MHLMESHYSIKKAAAVLGIGTDNVVAVKCDGRGKLIPSELERAILKAKRQGKVPLYVSATAGTTVYGAFDPLACIADICDKYNLWMHVDGVLQACNQLCAGYLFQPDKQYDTAYDTGDKTIQCGRHVDVFKLWLMWRAKGTQGFEILINRFLELAEYLYMELKTRKNYELVFDAEIAPKIKARMIEEGTAMVGYQPHGDNVNFFRMVFSNPAAKKSDVDFLLEEIERLGKDL